MLHKVIGTEKNSTNTNLENKKMPIPDTLPSDQIGNWINIDTSRCKFLEKLEQAITLYVKRMIKVLTFIFRHAKRSGF
jgi:hypothetical protein